MDERSSAMLVIMAIAVALSSCIRRENASPVLKNVTFLVRSDLTQRANTSTNQLEKQAAIDLFPPSWQAEKIEPDRDRQRFADIIHRFNNNLLPSDGMPNIMQAIALEFLGAPYQEGLLDRSDRETLVVTLSGFDCVLFIETVLAISRGITRGDTSYETFRDRLEFLRYGNGNLNGYCSRLHYFTEWISDNQRRGIVENIRRVWEERQLSNVSIL